MPVVAETTVRRTETRVNSERMERCSSFERCNAPKCPLDELYDIRVEYPGDKRCKADQPARIKLGADLPHKGLLPREWKGIIDFYGSWENYLLHKDDKRPVPRSLQKAV